jgi:hypothetical protein
MAKSYSKSIAYDGGGYYAEVYTDDDDASGYGDNAMVGRWYGSRAECEAVKPEAVKLYPLTVEHGPDPFDLACERRFD